MTGTTATDVMARCDELDRHSAHPRYLERVYLSKEHAAANLLAERWMTEAGMRTWQDAAGNQYGRLEGREPGLPALLLGSHLDTVPDAGSYDGMLGVVIAIATAARLRDKVAKFPFALEVVGFSDEEGTRFGTALLGSRAAAGTWEEDWWDLRDRDGVTLYKAFQNFGLDPRRVADAKRTPHELVGYLEAHIEQGPFLEAAGKPLGYVTTIAGARRFMLSVVGEARHAGGTPYPRRKDALVGASEAIVAIETLAKVTDCIATVGRLEVQPGAINVIPGRVDFSLDLRAETDAERDAMWDEIRIEIQTICARRRLQFYVNEAHSATAMPCAPRLQDAVIAGIESTGDQHPMGMWSRAGHDGMAIGKACDIAMLFIRCLDGISHHPDESVTAADVGTALDAFESTVLSFAAAYV
ncbi:MAG: hydantoinase [Nocardioidaceae bacterium]|nr:hydantoinase [Nocardioidaceae bacterium]